MVDLGVSTKVAGLVLSALAAVPDLKILVGDSAAPLSNTECAVGVQIAANTTFAQVYPTRCKPCGNQNCFPGESS